MSTDDQPTLEELESLFINNPEIDEIRAYVGRFNPIKTMRVEGKEIRHSYILRWLLDPQETHGLGDTFLKAFLAEALRGQGDSGSPFALDVFQADMMDAEIKIEWHVTKDRRIDLLILTPKNHWIFVIENKFDSTQGEDQLKDYMDSVESKFNVGEGEIYKSARGVFLTLSGEEPEDNRYATIGYDSICKLLERRVLSGQYPLTAEVETFLKHYLEIIQEATGMSEERTNVEKLARELYRKHGRVLDFIVNHGKTTDFTIACEDIFGANLELRSLISVDECEFVFSWASPIQFGLLPKSWFDVLDEHHWELGWKYWVLNLPLTMFVQLQTNADGGGKISLYSEVGPLKDHDFRRRLIEAITDVANKKGLKKIKFQSSAIKEGTKTSLFFKDNSRKVDDVQNSEKIKDTIKELLKLFRSEIDAVGEALQNFVESEKTQSPQP